MLAWLALLLPQAGAQGFDNSALSGDYYFVHLTVTAGPSGALTRVTNLGGRMVFDAQGSFTFDGQMGMDAGPADSASGSGVYSVEANASVALTNPAESGREINARLGTGSLVLLGSSTEARDGSFDLFVAVKAPQAGVDNSTLDGAYTLAALSFPNGEIAAMNSALVTLAADGAGGFSEARVSGHAADQDSLGLTEPLVGATYSLNGDGSGAASFGSSSSLFSGDRTIFVSEGGGFVIGLSTSAGGRDLFVGTKNLPSPSGNRSWRGSYWIAELTADLGFASFSSATGAIRADGEGNAALAQRLNTGGGNLDFSGINPYSINADSTGNFGFFLDARTVNTAIGIPVGSPESPAAAALVGAQVPAPATVSPLYGLFVGIRVPSFTGDGVYVSPLGVLNAASFAPPTFPLAAGSLVSLFGEGLSEERVRANAIPLPTALGSVTVTVDGIPVPLFFVSATQINLQIPFSVSGSTASIVVSNAGVSSNEVTVPLAPGGPGIFSLDQSGSGQAIVTHADFRLVRPEQPAAPGETVIVFLTGLGALNPPVADGDRPAELSRATDPGIQVFFGGEAGEVLFAGAAPCCVALYQINVTIPEVVFTGVAIPVAVSTSNGWSDFVDIAIQF